MIPTPDIKLVRLINRLLRRSIAIHFTNRPSPLPAIAASLNSRLLVRSADVHLTSRILLQTFAIRLFLRLLLLATAILLLLAPAGCRGARHVTGEPVTTTAPDNAQRCPETGYILLESGRIAVYGDPAPGVVPGSGWQVPGQTHKFEVHFIDVGQGDAILVLTPSRVMLVDAGPRDGDAASYLRSLGVDGIDLVIATHPHADHIGGMPAIFDAFPVREIIDPGIPHTTITYTRYLEHIDSLEIPYTVGRAGMMRGLHDNAFAEIIHPADPGDELLNDVSVVVRLVLGKVTALLAGDIEARSEMELLDRFGWPQVGPNMETSPGNGREVYPGTGRQFEPSQGSGRQRKASQGSGRDLTSEDPPETSPLSSNILKVAHHGSSTSSHPAFIKAVGPETSIIMCGLYNPFGNPHRQTLATLEEAGSQVWRTDLHGHIVVRSDGTGYSVDITRLGQEEPGMININEATLEELLKIIHIGPERAGQIIRLRPFESVDDLIRVDGIGPARLEDIKRQNIVVVE